MHRVELKATSISFTTRLSSLVVPNAPCGVERFIYIWFKSNTIEVPNAPCGVERVQVDLE